MCATPARVCHAARAGMPTRGSRARCRADHPPRVMRSRPPRGERDGRSERDSRRRMGVAEGKQPNILVIWGDDIGITNLSCYSDGLMGYRTPNIDRIADEGMRFTDSYGEQSCTAGRSSFITGQSVLPHRAEQGRHARRRHRAAAPRTRRSPSCSSRWATRPASSARTTSATRTSSCRPSTASTSSSATSTTSTPRRSPSSRTTRRPTTSRSFRERFAPRGVIHSWATDEDDDTDERPLRRVGRQRIEDTGPADQEADGDDRRRGPRSRDGLHRAPARGRDAVLRAGSTPPTCTSARTPSPRASARRGAGSRRTTTR